MGVTAISIEPFTEEPLRFLDSQGRPLGELDHGLREEDLVQMFRLMVRTRAADERALILQKQGTIAFYASSAGQEATHVGTAYGLREEDWVFPAHREQGVFITKGMSLHEIFAHFLSKASDPAKGRQMPGHLGTIRKRLVPLSSPVGTQIPQAVGCAMASKYKKKKEVTLVYFGDGGTSEGDFHSGMNWAGVFQAPVVFICVNNQYAISVPIHRQTATKTFAQKACAYGFEGYRVDGNDVIMTYVVTRQAIERARAGEGPTLIECVTYRYAPHSSADDDKRYRSTKEIEYWKKNWDPIQRMRNYLIGQGILTEEQTEALVREEKEQVQKVVEEVLKEPHPPLTSFLEDVYTHEIWILREEKALVEELYRDKYSERGEAHA